ncbi:hypothetical protein GUITHDRAFT_148043 [Guillardia theta CCMP2712]|uniref:Uncharacterized protein n=1 Tax=Guillardia theta (strain CCMP2712) TaxID=905079 RepID=L1IBF3_GUITC|nr:hypothetical protein GUITHDRAFT_148043 [Guillardia theta CCMP2712]EKX33244.1 hypothetical protein GUITHDRAFT_148043 [Guillardia theta CCMP2712]|eukprot:XP_005820224.1 hypothetical protein GUITHDRAFT_148043 [Guillardia theta CCMP2712]
MSEDPSFFHVLVPDPKLPRTLFLEELSTSNHLFDLGRRREKEEEEETEPAPQVVVSEFRRVYSQGDNVVVIAFDKFATPATAWCPRCSIQKEKPTWRIFDRIAGGTVHNTAYMPAFSEEDGKLHSDRDLMILYELNFNSFLETQDIRMAYSSAEAMQELSGRRNLFFLDHEAMMAGSGLYIVSDFC